MLRAYSLPMGPKDRPKTQPIGGLGWVGLWALWAILRSIMESPRFCLFASVDDSFGALLTEKLETVNR